MNLKTVFFFITVGIIISVWSSTVSAGTVTEYSLNTSNTQEGNVKYRVILPSSYSTAKKYPVLYLLHCAGGTYQDWQTISKVDQLIDKHTFIAVSIGDGRSDSLCWWLDSPIKTKSKWATFITTELKPKIDATFSTYANKANTGIMGFSMGGFGALHIIAKRPDLFGTALSINGAVCPINYANGSDPYGLKTLLGDPVAQKSNYTAVNICDNITNYQGKKCIIRFYNCVNDGFITNNNNLEIAMCSKSIPHDRYILFKNPGLDGHKYPSQEDMEAAMIFFDKSFLNGDKSLKAQYDPNDYGTMVRRTIENRKYMQFD